MPPPYRKGLGGGVGSRVAPRSTRAAAESYPAGRSLPAAPSCLPVPIPPFAVDRLLAQEAGLLEVAALVGQQRIAHQARLPVATKRGLDVPPPPQHAPHVGHAPGAVARHLHRHRTPC